MFGFGSSHAFSGELDAMGVVYEAIHNGVCISWIADDDMPAGDRKLGCDDCRASAVTLLEDLEKVVTRSRVERF